MTLSKYIYYKFFSHFDQSSNFFKQTPESQNKAQWHMFGSISLILFIQWVWVYEHLKTNRSINHNAVSTTILYLHSHLGTLLPSGGWRSFGGFVSIRIDRQWDVKILYSKVCYCCNKNRKLWQTRVLTRDNQLVCASFPICLECVHHFKAAFMVALS